jgi:hypothetical protein
MTRSDGLRFYSSRFEGASAWNNEREAGARAGAGARFGFVLLVTASKPGVSSTGGGLRHDQHPQREEQTLDEMAWSRKPLRGAVQLVQRVHKARAATSSLRWMTPAPSPASRAYRPTGRPSEGQGRRDHQRPLPLVTLNFTRSGRGSEPKHEPTQLGRTP